MSYPRVDLDYEASSRGRVVPGLLVFAFASITAGVLLENYREVRVQLSALDAVQGLGASERTAAKPSTEERKSAEGVMRQLSLPWSSMIRAVERAANQEIAVLQLQPEARDGLLRLTAEARSEKAMLEYLRRLAASEALADVHLAAHQVVQDDPLRPIQFTAIARLRGAR